MTCPNPIYTAKRLLVLPKDQRLVWTRFRDRTTTQRKEVDKIWVVAGNQLIDNFWKVLKNTMPKTVTATSDVSIEKHVREAQWLYWNSDCDKWCAMSEVFC